MEYRPRVLPFFYEVCQSVQLPEYPNTKKPQLFANNTIDNRHSATIMKWTEKTPSQPGKVAAGATENGFRQIPA